MSHLPLSPTHTHLLRKVLWFVCSFARVHAECERWLHPICTMPRVWLSATEQAAQAAQPGDARPVYFFAAESIGVFRSACDAGPVRCVLRVACAALSAGQRQRARGVAGRGLRTGGGFRQRQLAHW